MPPSGKWEKVETLLLGPANTQGEARPALLRVRILTSLSSPRDSDFEPQPPPPASPASPNPGPDPTSGWLTSGEVEDPIVAV